MARRTDYRQNEMASIRRAVLGLAAVLLVGLTGACTSTEKPSMTPGEHARGWIAPWDPTGLAAEQDARKLAWEAIRAQAELIDVEGFNEAVQQLAIAVNRLSERMEVVRPEDLAAIRDDLRATTEAIRIQVEQLQIEPIRASIDELTQTVEETLKGLETERLNALAADSQQALADVRRTLESWDGMVRTAMDDARGLMKTSDDQLRALPTEQLRVSLARIDEDLSAFRDVVEELRARVQPVGSTLMALRAAAWAAFAVLILAGLRMILAWRGKKEPGKGDSAVA